MEEICMCREQWMDKVGRRMINEELTEEYEENTELSRSIHFYIFEVKISLGALSKNVVGIELD